VTDDPKNPQSAGGDASGAEGDPYPSQSWLPFPVQPPRVRPPLTSTQKQVLDFIVEYRRERGVSPTLQEIGDRLKTHRVTVHAHVKALLDKRYLVRFSERASRSLIPADELASSHARSIEAGDLPEELGPSGLGPLELGASKLEAARLEAARSGANLLPLAGRIAAGQPIEAVYDNEVIDIGALFPRERDLYVLEVSGDSMIDDQIRHGDYVVVERRSTARNGEIIVAVLPTDVGTHGEATLKRFYREGKRVRLQPANPAMEPIYVEPPSRLEVRGVVVGIIRRYR
jgi:repressor LexA